jgi:hypothetical protein
MVVEDFQVSKPKLKAGDAVWFVPREKYNGPPRELTVTKVGRKWATLGEGWRSMRADLVTWDVDGGEYSSPGQLYALEDEWQTEKKLEEHWSVFLRWVSRRYRRPKHLTATQIEEVFAVLRGDEE